MKFLLSLLALSLLCAPLLAAPVRLAIIIDDLGNSLTSGLDAIALPGNISFAVMPHRKHSHTLATRAGRLGKEVLLHAPMSTIRRRALGPGALHEGLNEQQFKDTLAYAIDSIPYVRGINNHMGSQLTSHPTYMGWVMQVLQTKGLFFIDSRTHPRSIAHQTALQAGIHSARRDIFLDNETNIDHIHQQFKRALGIAQRYGSAIAIGHPYPSTLLYLKEVLPQLDRNRVELHFISDLLIGGMQPRPLDAQHVPDLPQPSLDQLVHKLRAANH
ncbi:MAG: divergent polysaccharide deacetylase family protein [Bermanella sp.]